MPKQHYSLPSKFRFLHFQITLCASILRCVAWRRRCLASSASATIPALRCNAFSVVMLRAGIVQRSFTIFTPFTISTWVLRTVSISFIKFLNSFLPPMFTDLVFVTEYIEHLREKLLRNECIYCEKTYGDRNILMEHMRKKNHREVNPKNNFYDRVGIHDLNSKI